ncbi:MAG: multidrug effflux MFS transporter [Candidatus Cyclobacteriaceae bacterium M2_1C_046]
MTKKERLTIILVLGGLIALGPFTIDMYLPGFSSIADSLNTTIAMVGLSLTSYFIGISLGQIVYGPLIDRFGRKKPLLIGLLIYAVAAVGCALSPDIYTFIGLRFILALGGCVGMVAGRAVVRDLFPADETAKVFSSLLLVMGVAPIIAPTLGGYVTAHFGWRYIFVFLTILSMVILLMVKYFLPHSKDPDINVSLRPKNVLKDYLKVLKDPTFLTYSFAGSFAFSGMFSYLAGSPFIYMEYFGLTETEYGWMFGLNALGFITCSQINRLWLRRRDSEGIVLRAMVIQFFTGLALLLYTNLMTPAAVPTFALIIIYLGCLGFIIPNTTAVSLKPFIKHAGSASALLGSIQMVTGAISSALVSALHNNTTLPMTLIMALGSAIGLGILLFSLNRSKQRESLKLEV